ncbi:MAG: anti-sigma factor family protein [Burkholderiales bacterium]
MSTNEKEGVDEIDLMAYADGQADAATIRKIELALTKDVTVRERIERFRASAKAARLALDLGVQPAVPAVLEAAVRAAIAKSRAMPTSVVHPRSGLSRAANDARFALAASVAALIFGTLGFFFGKSGQDAGQSPISGLTLTQNVSERAAFIEALNSTPSGQMAQLSSSTSGPQVEMIASVRHRNGELCREFRVSRGHEATVGVACRPQGDWVVTFASLVRGAGAGYTPASSTTVLDAYLSSIEAGPPLNNEDEKAALSNSPRR